MMVPVSKNPTSGRTTNMQRERITFIRALKDPRVQATSPNDTITRPNCQHEIIVQSPSMSWCGQCGKRAF